MNSTSLLLTHFPSITEKQQNQFNQLLELYTYWNARINVISRKDIDQFYTHHVLHSLGIAKIVEFQPNTEIVDVGTGGGFPGIPLAILFPHANFHLVDSIGKKIKVVNEVVQALNLTNVTTSHARVESLPKKFDFVVSRAVTAMPEFYAWVKTKFNEKSFNEFPNGILYLKGGDLTQELKPLIDKCQIFELSDFFKEPFFETKKVVYLQRF